MFASQFKKKSPEKTAIRNANDLQLMSHLPVAINHVQETVEELFVPQFLELKAVANEVGEQLAIEYDIDLFWLFFTSLFPLDKLRGRQGSRFRLSAGSKLLKQYTRYIYMRLTDFVSFRCRKGIAHLILYPST